jgi:ring-1,2-phenylacetyl-CoA epoxidase subunit PaaC
VVRPLLAEATLTVPARSPFMSYGRVGRHTEHMGHLLAPMQVMQRTYPGCEW